MICPGTQAFGRELGGGLDIATRWVVQMKRSCVFIIILLLL